MQFHPRSQTKSISGNMAAIAECDPGGPGQILTNLLKFMQAFLPIELQPTKATTVGSVKLKRKRYSSLGMRLMQLFSMAREA